MKIEPYKSLGPIRFGMTPTGVESLLGPCQRLGTNRREEREEHRAEGLVVRYSSEKQTVCEMTVYRPGNAELGGINLFPDPQRAFAELCLLDGSPFECVGIIVFLKLGIALTGFHDAHDEQLAVAVFEEGRWDVMRTRFKPYVF